MLVVKKVEVFRDIVRVQRKIVLDKRLTAEAFRMYCLLCSFEEGDMISMPELGELLGYSSPTTVRKYKDELIEFGLVSIRNTSGRNPRIFIGSATQKARDLVDEWEYEQRRGKREFTGRKSIFAHKQSYDGGFVEESDSSESAENGDEGVSGYTE